jgi:hypothetical protein
MNQNQQTWMDLVLEMESTTMASTQERADWLGRRMRELQAITYCSYCGQQEHNTGLTDEQRQAAMLEHILTCEKRPELKLINVALAAEEAAEAFECNDGVDEVEYLLSRSVVPAMERLRVELDKLKVHPGSLPQFPADRCRVCRWPLVENIKDGCTKESCSQRPAPSRRADEGYAPAEPE